MTALLLIMLSACMTMLGYIVTGVIHVSVSNYLMKRKARKVLDPELCCCGSMLDDHGYYENHSFVSALDWHIECSTKKF